MGSNYTYSEINKQPETWKKTYQQVLENREEISAKIEALQPDEVIFTGCGTSYYISISAAYTFGELTGISSKPIPSSEIFLAPKAVFPKNKKVLLIAFSRSGNTSEVVKAVDYVQEHNLAECISITAYPESDLAKLSNYTIVLPHVQEKSVVMTGSFTNLLLTSQIIAGIVANNEAFLEELNQIPQSATAIWKETEELAKKIGENPAYQSFIYLGLGGHFGLASEGMLKMKEMTQVSCEAYNPLEFRHGPISVVTEEYMIIHLANNSIRKYEQDIVKDIQDVKGKVLTIGHDLDGYRSDEKLNLKASLSDHASSVLMLPFLQLVAYYRNKLLNLDPDKPRNLNQVVVLDG